MIVDAHVHCGPADAAGGLPPFLAECRRHGVSLAIVSSLGRWSHFPPPDEVRAANDEARQCAERSGGMAQWLAYLNPQNDDWRDELDRCIPAGAIGVKLWVALKDANGSLDNTEAVVRRAGERRLPLLVHTFHRTDPNLPGELVLEDLAALAERCPQATLVAAHAGANWRHSLGVLRDRAPNAHVDVSGCFPAQGMVEALVRDIGAGRVLFGSDMPGRSVPSQLAKVVLANITDDEKQRILCTNARRVFGLDAPPGPPLRKKPSPLRPDRQLPDLDTDHFCFCGRWPFFPTPCHSPQELDRLLAEHDIQKAYTGDLGSVYRLDIEQANAEFLESAQSTERVAPLAVLNPRADNWRQTIRFLPPGFAGAIVHPYLHGWRLDDSAHAAFFRACAEKRLPLWINCMFGDHRFRHPGLACRPVAAAELIQFAEGAPQNAYVFQGVAAADVCAFLERFSGDVRFRFEMSRLTDATGALEKVTGQHGLTHLVLGSEFPLRDIREVRWTARRQ